MKPRTGYNYKEGGEVQADALAKLDLVKPYLEPDDQQDVSLMQQYGRGRTGYDEGGHVDDPRLVAAGAVYGVSPNAQQAGQSVTMPDSPGARPDGTVGNVRADGSSLDPPPPPQPQRQREPEHSGRKKPRWFMGNDMSDSPERIGQHHYQRGGEVRRRGYAEGGWVDDPQARAAGAPYGVQPASQLGRSVTIPESPNAPIPIQRADGTVGRVRADGTSLDPPTQPQPQRRQSGGGGGGGGQQQQPQQQAQPRERMTWNKPFYYMGNDISGDPERYGVPPGTPHPLDRQRAPGGGGGGEQEQAPARQPRRRGRRRRRMNEGGEVFSAMDDFSNAANITDEIGGALDEMGRRGGKRRTGYDEGGYIDDPTSSAGFPEEPEPYQPEPEPESVGRHQYSAGQDESEEPARSSQGSPRAASRGAPAEDSGGDEGDGGGRSHSKMGKITVKIPYGSSFDNPSSYSLQGTSGTRGVGGFTLGAGPGPTGNLHNTRDSITGDRADALLANVNKSLYDPAANMNAYSTENTSFQRGGYVNGRRTGYDEGGYVDEPMLEELEPNRGTAPRGFLDGDDEDEDYNRGGYVRQRTGYDDGGYVDEYGTLEDSALPMTEAPAAPEMPAPPEPPPEAPPPDETSSMVEAPSAPAPTDTVDPAQTSTGYTDAGDGGIEPTIPEGAGYGPQDQPQPRSFFGQALDTARSWFGIGGAQAADQPAMATTGGQPNAQPVEPTVPPGYPQTQPGLLGTMKRELTTPWTNPYGERSVFGQAAQGLKSLDDRLYDYLNGGGGDAKRAIDLATSRPGVRADVALETLAKQYKAEGNVQGMAQLFQDIRPVYDRARTQVLTSLNNGNPTGAIQALTWQHNVLPNGVRLDVAQNPNGNFVATFTDAEGGGQPRSITLTPRQVYDFSQSNGSQFDHAIENDFEKNLTRFASGEKASVEDYTQPLPTVGHASPQAAAAARNPPPEVPVTQGGGITNAGGATADTATADRTRSGTPEQNPEFPQGNMLSRVSPREAQYQRQIGNTDPAFAQPTQIPFDPQSVPPDQRPEQFSEGWPRPYMPGVNGPTRWVSRDPAINADIKELGLEGATKKFLDARERLVPPSQRIPVEARTRDDIAKAYNMMRITPIELPEQPGALHPQLSPSEMQARRAGGPRETSNDPQVRYPQYAPEEFKKRYYIGGSEPTEADYAKPRPEGVRLLRPDEMPRPGERRVSSGDQNLGMLAVREGAAGGTQKVTHYTDDGRPVMREIPAYQDPADIKYDRRGERSGERLSLHAPGTRFDDNGQPIPGTGYYTDVNKGTPGVAMRGTPSARESYAGQAPLPGPPSGGAIPPATVRGVAEAPRSGLSQAEDLAIRQAGSSNQAPLRGPIMNAERARQAELDKVRAANEGRVDAAAATGAARQGIAENLGQNRLAVEGIRQGGQDRRADQRETGLTQRTAMRGEQKMDVARFNQMNMNQRQDSLLADRQRHDAWLGQQSVQKLIAQHGTEQEKQAMITYRESLRTGARPKPEEVEVYQKVLAGARNAGIELPNVSDMGPAAQQNPNLRFAPTGAVPPEVAAKAQQLGLTNVQRTPNGLWGGVRPDGQKQYIR